LGSRNERTARFVDESFQLPQRLRLPVRKATGKPTLNSTSNSAFASGAVDRDLPVSLTSLRMRKLAKALLLTAAASGVAYLVLDQLDLDTPEPPEDDIPGMDPESMPDGDVEMLLQELASHLGG